MGLWTLCCNPNLSGGHSCCAAAPVVVQRLRITKDVAADFGKVEILGHISTVPGPNVIYNFVSHVIPRCKEYIRYIYLSFNVDLVTDYFTCTYMYAAGLGGVGGGLIAVVVEYWPE